MSASHIDFAGLMAYWLGELDEAREAEVETHYLGCAECSARLAELEALAASVRTVFAKGLLATIVTPGFVERVRARGVQIREYVVPRNGSVNCSVAPQDDVLFGRMNVPLAGVERVDAIFRVEGDESRLEDVPFDAASGEVVLAPSIAHVRSLPAHQQVVRLVAVGGAGETLLGEYTFNHSPHRN
jgi:anti-sigma factor RsiW